MGKNFFILNIVQFLDALNENLFKYIVIYFLIFYEGHEQTSTIMAITGAVFILPFIFFSSVGGILADRWSKSKIIRATRALQLMILIFALLFILFHEGNWIYPILFIVAMLSALFGPSKYGIIPELIPKEKWLKANGYIAAFTYFGIIIGTALASFLDSITEENFALMVLFCVFVAGLGSTLSFFISNTPPANPEKKWPRIIYKEIFDALKDMYLVPKMLTAVFAYGYFLFIGAFVQMNIIPYSITTLQMSPIVGGYLFLVSSIGVGIGSLIAPKLNGKMTSLPISGIGMSVGCFLFTLVPHPFWINIIWLIGLGISGGLFLVPPQAYIMSNSRPENEGRNFGTANFFSFVAALLAALVLYLFNSVLNVSPAMSFTWIGILNLAVAFVLFFLTRNKYHS